MAKVLHFGTGHAFWYLLPDHTIPDQTRPDYRQNDQETTVTIVASKNLHLGKGMGDWFHVVILHGCNYMLYITRIERWVI